MRLTILKYIYIYILAKLCGLAELSINFKIYISRV